MECCALRENGVGGGASGDSEIGVDNGGQQFLKKIRGSVGSAGDSFSALALSLTWLAAAVSRGLCERPQLFTSRLPEFFTWLLRCGPEHCTPLAALLPAAGYAHDHPPSSLNKIGFRGARLQHYRPHHLHRGVQHYRGQEHAVEEYMVGENARRALDHLPRGPCDHELACILQCGATHNRSLAKAIACSL